MSTIGLLNFYSMAQGSIESKGVIVLKKGEHRYRVIRGNVEEVGRGLHRRNG